MVDTDGGHDLTCGICLIDIPTTYMECFHKVCSTCVKSIDKCPYCRYDFSCEFISSVRHPVCEKNKFLKYSSSRSSRVGIEDDNILNYLINNQMINTNNSRNIIDINNINLTSITTR